MIWRDKRRIRRIRGAYELQLPSEERALLARLPEELMGVIAELEDSSASVPEAVRRLFPPAYPTDEEAEASYVALARRELAEYHRHALSTLIKSANEARLSDDEAESWLAAINDLRLALGSSLGVTEEYVEPDPADPRFTDWICYHYLSFLQGELIDAMAEALPASADSDEPLPDDPWGAPPGGLRWDGTDIPPQT